MAAGPNYQQDLVDELIGGDPFLTPLEVQEILGLDQDQLLYRAGAGIIASVQPGGPGTERRYRTSVITALAAEKKGAR
jgi:hypothetical protein